MSHRSLPLFHRSFPRHGRFQFFFDRANYAAAPEGTATVTVFLRETFDPRTDESLLAPGTDGLLSAGVVVQVGGPLPAHPAFVRTTAAILGNTGFDLAVVARMPSPEYPDSASLLELSTKPVFGEVASRSPGCESVLLPLGTFTFTTGTALGEVTCLTALVAAEHPYTPGESNVTGSGVVLDPWIQPAGATVTVSAKALAPRPVSASSVAAALAALKGDRKRRNC
jgi:hypothetical protein